MAIHLKRNEKVIEKLHPGKTYRLLILIRDIILALFSTLVFGFILKELGIHNNKLIFWVCLIIFALWILLAIVNQINLILIQYYITDERIVIKRGWLNRNLIDIPLEHIVSTEATQSFQERMIGCGTIYLKTANDVKTEGDKLENVDKPFRVNTIISELIDEQSEKNK